MSKEQHSDKNNKIAAAFATLVVLFLGAALVSQCANGNSGHFVGGKDISDEGRTPPPITDIDQRVRNHH